MSFKSRFLGGYTPSFLPSWKDPFYKGYDLDGALAKYDFSIPDLDLAILEQVNRQVSMLTLRDANQNVEQLSGTIKTYTQGEAGLVVGSSALIEGAATNKCTNYNFKPTDFTNVTQAGTATFSVSSAYSALLSGPSNGNAYLIDNSGEVAASSLTFGGTAANTNTHSMSARVYVISGSAKLRRSTTATGEVTIAANTGFDRSVLEGFTAAAGDQVMVEAAAGAVVAVVANQLVEAANVSSEIEVSGSSATRDACDCTLDAYLEMGALLENHGNSSVLANFDITSNGLTLVTQVGYKYHNALVAAMIGAVVEVTRGNFATISAVPTAASATLDPINYSTLANDTDVDVISINWNRSAYTEAQVITLRTTAGDANVWPAAVAWPVNNFTHTFSYEYRGGANRPCIFELYGDFDNNFNIYHNVAEPNTVRVRHRIASVSSIVTVTMPSSIDYGDSVTVTASLSSTTGISATVTNVTKSETASNSAPLITADLPTVKTVKLGTGLTPFNAVNISLKEHTLT